MEVVDEVATAVADHAECAPNSATSARAVSHELGVPRSTIKKNSALHFTLVPLEDSDCSATQTP